MRLVTAADLVLIALAAAGIALLFAQQWRPPVAAASVEVRAEGRLVGRYPLAQDRALEVLGARGLSRIEVAGGRARFRDGPCRNRVCVRRGWLAHQGEAAACLPNRVSLTLAGDGAVDAVSR